jgi:hypothetical protein
MDHHHGVLARLDDLVEVADRADAHGARKRAIDPDGFATAHQITPDQIGRRQVVMAGNGDQRTLEPPRHVFHKARLAAAGRPLEQHRQLIRIGRIENLNLVAGRFVIRFLLDEVFGAVQQFSLHGLSVWLRRIKIATKSTKPTKIS